MFYRKRVNDREEGEKKTKKGKKDKTTVIAPERISEYVDHEIFISCIFTTNNHLDSILLL